MLRSCCALFDRVLMQRMALFSNADLLLLGAAVYPFLCRIQSQLVDRLDYGAFSTSAAGTMSYQGLYKLVSKALYRTHVEGKLKREIIQVKLWDE